MSISTFNFQFYNYKLNPASPGYDSAMALGSGASIGSGSGSGSTSYRTSTSNSFISELEMDIDEDMSSPSETSTPKPRFTSQLALELTKNQNGEGIPALRPKLHTAQKRWSMELREKVLEMSKRNNASDVQLNEPQAAVQQQEEAQLQQQQQQQQQQLQYEQQHLQQETEAAAVAPTVSDKINFFNKLTNTFESSGNTNSHRNRFISLLRSSRPQVAATTGSNSSLSSIGSQATTTTTTQMVPPPKPKRLGASAPIPSPFATPTGVGKGGSHRKCSLRRKPSMDKSRATISRQNSSATVRPQHHAIMEDLSLVVPVRLRIAEYEQRILMSA